MSVNEKCLLFDSFVGSVLNYNASVWGYHDAKHVEQIQNKFLRKVLKVKKSTNLEGMYGEINRYPLKITRKLIMIKYWLSLMKTKNSLLINIYQMLAVDANRGLSYSGLNWAYHIKLSLEEIGLGYVWNLQNYTNYDVIKQRILDIYKQNWYFNINNSSRLSQYSLFKHDFKMEKYLTCNLDTKYVTILTKFRLYSNNLNIETGRYDNTDRNSRHCRQCNMGMIEDQYHFLLVCPKYRHLRQRFFKPYYCKWPTVEKFSSLMSSVSPKTINKIARFLFHAFKDRI